MVKALPTAAESSHFDGNQVASVVGVQGTLGTADVTGSAPTVPLGIDPTTGAAYVYNLGPAGSVTLGNITGGTINLIGSISTIGTMPAVSLALNTGTITTIAAGTQNTLGTVGTVLGVGVVTSVTNLASGTLLNSGTTTGVGVVSNLTNGSVNVLTGTITSITNNAYGTTTVDPKPVQVGTYAMTLGTTGAAAWGTLVASVGNGLKVYVTGVDVVVSSGTVDIAVTNNVAGSVGTGVFVRGQFVQGGGISKNFIPTLQTGTGGTIAYWLGGAGTATLGIQYWVAA